MASAALPVRRTPIILLPAAMAQTVPMAETAATAVAAAMLPNVDVRVAFQPAANSSGHPLLQIRVATGGESRLFLVDPQGGSLYVSADGGRGGSGGRGGRGGHGGSGGIGSPNGSDGMNGSDGRNGSDGFAGSGGLITVTYDSRAKPYLNAIHLSSWNGPNPVFREAYVPPLW